MFLAELEAGELGYSIPKSSSLILSSLLAVSAKSKAGFLELPLADTVGPTEPEGYDRRRAGEEDRPCVHCTQSHSAWPRRYAFYDRRMAYSLPSAV